MLLNLAIASIVLRSLLSKRDGGVDFCVEYQKPNDVTNADMYPVPGIADCQVFLLRVSIFATLEFFFGYWQMHMREEDINKMAFTCPERLFEFTQMPFGLKNAVQLFKEILTSYC